MSENLTKREQLKANFEVHFSEGKSPLHYAFEQRFGNCVTIIIPHEARWAQETQNVAGVGGAQCQRLLNKVKHISICRPKARVMIFRQMQFEKQF